NREKRIDKLAPRNSTWKRVKLRAVTHLAKQSFRAVSWYTQQRHRPACRTQQSRHQIHQRRFTRPVWSNETGYTRCNRKINPIDAEYLSVELGDVVEDDQIIFHNGIIAHISSDIYQSRICFDRH